jgi:hypothetical protein
MTKSLKTESPVSSEHPLDQAIARALRDNLVPLQRTVEELERSYADLVAACDASRVGSALPALLRTQSAAASLAAGLGVLSNFVTVALQQREGSTAGARAAAEMVAAHVASVQTAVETAPEAARKVETQRVVAEPPAPVAAEEPPATRWHSDAPVTSDQSFQDTHTASPSEIAAQQISAAEESLAASQASEFDVSSLSGDIQELHRRAKRVAKVAMQDIKMLRPKDVRLGRENHDICVRVRDDMDKARKEYDRRFKAILDHPVDYFHDYAVAILADGDPKALGEYPYPSAVLRH